MVAMMQKMTTERYEISSKQEATLFNEEAMIWSLDFGLGARGEGRGEGVER